MKTVLIRADASPRMGTGHIMRCLTLAEALAGQRVVFACAEATDSMVARIHAAGHELARLGCAPGGEADLAATLALATRADALVVDGYAFSSAYRSGLRKAAHPILALDDLADRDLAADIVVNASPAADSRRYGGQSGNPECLLGTAYALVSQRFMAWRHAPVQEDAPLLLTFGGSDPLGLTLPVLERLRALLPEAPLLAVVGGSVPHADAVARSLARLGACALRDVRDMAPVLRACRLAISAAGTTLFELAALGRPAMLAIVADNQREGALAAQAQGWAKTLDGRGPDAARSLAEQAAALWHDEDALKSLADSAMKQVDGQGPRRIAQRLLTRLA